MRSVLPALILALHAWLAIDAASRLSPVWDEIVYPAAGYSYWHTGQLQLNTEHGILSKLILAAPLVALKPALPVEDPSWGARDSFRFGFQFTFHNRVPAQRLIFWSRMPAVLFSVLTGLLLYGWIRSIWGQVGGLISLICYATVPIFLSRASLALLEMPMYFFILLSLVLYDRWMQRGHRSALAGCGVALGLAVLCKVNALVLVPTFLLMAFRGKNPGPSRGLKEAPVLLAIAAITIFLAYLPWGNSWPALEDVFRNLRGYSSRLPFYFHGRWIAQASPVVSWAALLIKAPLLVWILAVGGMIVWKREGRRTSTLLLLQVFAGATLLMISFRYAVSTVQVSAVYLALACSAGALGTLWASARPRKRWLGAALLGLAFDAGSAHPDYLAYFNLLVGGPNNGYRWLADSDQDWGQWLPALAQDLKRQPSPGLVLGYSGAADPRIYGLRYQDLLSPALVSKEYSGEPVPERSQPIYLAVGTKLFQTEPAAFAWLEKNLRPLPRLYPSMRVYEITVNAESFRWLGYLYSALRRNALAKSAFEKAQKLDPGNPDDAQALEALRSKS